MMEIHITSHCIDGDLHRKQENNQSDLNTFELVNKLVLHIAFLCFICVDISFNYTKTFRLLQHVCLILNCFPIIVILELLNNIELQLDILCFVFIKICFFILYLFVFSNTIASFLNAPYNCILELINNSVLQTNFPCFFHFCFFTQLFVMSYCCLFSSNAFCIEF